MLVVAIVLLFVPLARAVIITAMQGAQIFEFFTGNTGRKPK